MEQYQYPELLRVRQRFERPVIDDIHTVVAAQIERLDLRQQLRPGQSVAITAGSRGIANIAAITRAIVAEFKRLDTKPFVVPAMGSHGGATAEGQLGVLAHYGITENFCGCPIQSSLETVIVDQSEFGFPIHFDQRAHEADHVVVVNRIKAHTSIAGELESGLVKMLLIGLGNHAGAGIYHRAMADYSFARIAEEVAPRIVENCRIVAGIGIVENAYDETALIEAISPRQLITREKELLRKSKELMARLPFPEIDVLLVDQIGKNISGTGMDTNVIGRKFNDHATMADEHPKIKRICVRSLTRESAGNATGIGMAEFCHSRFVDQIDRRATNVNCITALHPTGAMLPMDFATEREMLEAAFSTIGLTSPRDARFVWIRDTLFLEEIVCSASFSSQIEQNPDLEVVDDGMGLSLGESELPWPFH